MPPLFFAELNRDPRGQPRVVIHKLDVGFEALAGGDLEESYALWQQAQSEVLAQEVPWVWLVNIDHLYWVRGGLAVAQQKLHPHGHGWSIVNNVDQWSWTA